MTSSNALIAEQVSPLTKLPTPSEALHFETYPCGPSRSLDEIFRLRYQVFFEEMGRDQRLVDSQQKILKDHFDLTADHVVAKVGDQVVACARANYRKVEPLPDPELYLYDRVCSSPAQPIALVSKVVVHSRYRGTGIFIRLCRELATQMMNRGTELMFVATNDRLVPLFRRLGFREIGNRHEQWADYGSSNPMVIDARDLNYLKSIRSPMVKAYDEVTHPRFHFRFSNQNLITTQQGAL